MATSKKLSEVSETSEQPEPSEDSAVQVITDPVTDGIARILEQVRSIRATVDFIADTQNGFMNSMNERLTLVSERLGVLENRADAQRAALQQLGNMQNEMSAAADAAIEQLQSLVTSGPLKMLGLGKLFGNIRPALNAPEGNYNDEAHR